MNLETKTKNINNQSLFKEIDGFLMEVFSTTGINWTSKLHREAMVNMVDDWMGAILNEELGKIIQHDVLCDARNNTDEDLKNSVIRFTVRYRQKNCYNTSEIEYVFRT